jgi:hypothetical protein
MIERINSIRKEEISVPCRTIVVQIRTGEGISIEDEAGVDLQMLETLEKEEIRLIQIIKDERKIISEALVGVGATTHEEAVTIENKP